MHAIDFNYNDMPMNVVHVVMCFLIIISNATNEFLPEDNKDIVN